MKKVVKRGLLLPLRIQLFAENGDGDNGGDNNQPAPKTYTEEEFNKMKAAFDKASSDLAEEKKKAKARMSDDEKKKTEDEEKQRKFEEMEKELNKLKLTSSLAKVFEESEIEGIVNAIVDNDVQTLADLISKSHEAYKKKVTDEAKKEFSKSSSVPGGNGSSSEDDEETKKIEELAKAQSSGNKAKTDNKAWNNYKERH